MSKLTTHEVLVGARNYLEEHGWVQATMTDGERVCVLGAIKAASGRVARPWHCGLFPHVQVLIQALTGKVGAVSSDPLTRWNDAPGRTKEEVLDLFDKAIALTAPQPDTTFLAEVREEVPA